MNKVNIYTYTTIKGPGTRSGSYTYILEYLTGKGPATLTKQGILEQVTEKQAHLKMLIEVLDRLKMPCEIVLHTENSYIKSGIENWLAGWISTGWVNARGNPVANQEEWKKVAERLRIHVITIQVQETHSYSEWIRLETKKKEKERLICLNDLESLTAQRKSTRPQ